MVEVPWGIDLRVRKVSRCSYFLSLLEPRRRGKACVLRLDAEVAAMSEPVRLRLWILPQRASDLKLRRFV